MFHHSLKRSREDDEDLPQDPKKFRPGQTTTDSVSLINSPALLPELNESDQALRFRAPTLTPIDSDEESHGSNNNKHAFHTATATKLAHPRPSTHPLNQGPAKLLLSGDNLSAWHQTTFTSTLTHNHPSTSHSLDINDSALTAPGFGHDDLDFNPAYVPAPPTAAPDTPMEDIYPQKDQDYLPTIRLPSPVSDADMAMMDTMDPEPEYPYRVPTPGLDYGTVSPQPVAAHPMSRSASRQSTPNSCPIPHRRSALVMGYRADCDKCRCKVPGHYSHIIQRV